jgi:superfamily II RNA helicase
MIPPPMELTTRDIRAIVGSAVFVAVAAYLFEGVGQSSARPAPVRSNAYRPVPIDDHDVTTALNFALADQKKKNRSDNAVALRQVLTAERQASKGDNFRLCLSLTRRGRLDTARTVVHRNQKREWSVAIWAWGACGK